MSLTYEIVACPVCQADRGSQLADREEIRRELEDLWSFHLQRLHPGTPVRYLFDRVVFSQEPPLRLAECGGCGTIFRNPRESAGDLVELYATERPDAGVLRTLFENQRRAYRVQARRLTRAFGKPGTGLEVGSYLGAFLAAARQAGWDFEGLDVNEAASDFARGQGLRVASGTLEDLEPGRTYDSVAIWNCFEQLPDPRTAARAARRLLSPGGVLAVRVPNGAYYASLRRWLDGPAAPLARMLLAHNNLLGFPYRHGFTPASLAALLRAEGFEPVHVLGDTLVPIADRWTRGWAVYEERLVKALQRRLAGPRPWFEVYARVRRAEGGGAERVSRARCPGGAGTTPGR